MQSVRIVIILLKYVCVCVYLCIEKLIVGKFTPELNPLLNIFTTYICNCIASNNDQSAFTKRFCEISRM
jgi:hypothetical protein